MEAEPLPQHPFEVGIDYLASHIDDMVDVTFADIQSQFLIMPRGQNFIEFGSFQDAYEALKQETDAFARFNDETVWKALERNALVFVVVRTILGVSPPEWADLAKAERDVMSRRMSRGSWTRVAAVRPSILREICLPCRAAGSRRWCQ